MSYQQRWSRSPSLFSPANSGARLELPDGEQRFAALLEKALKPGDAKFAQSLSDQYDKRVTLTEKQVECLVRLEQRYSEGEIASRAEWEVEYRKTHRSTAIIAAKYYITTQYFRDLAVNIATDESFVPTQRQFDALTKNKYAARAIATATTPSKFPAGSLCKVRSNQSLLGSARLQLRIGNQVALVLENHRTGIFGASTVLVNGETIKLEDRALKPISRKKEAKEKLLTKSPK